MKLSTIILITLCFLSHSTKAQDPSLTGYIWLEIDNDYMYDNEEGIDGVKVYLKDHNTDDIIDSTLSTNLEFNFPSSTDIVIPAGDYYLEIPKSEFGTGSPLHPFQSCPVDNDANDGVDHDDNGIGTEQQPILTTPFALDNMHVEYVDFCFLIACNEENILAAPSCDQIQEIDVICDIPVLGTFCNSLPTGNSPGNQPNPLCPDGGAPNNITWFAFTAYDGVYELVLSPSYCSGSNTGLDGIQMGIYTDCTFSESVICNSACSVSPISIESSLLIPGAVYYMFIDGCGSSVCSYEIEIIGNPIPPNVLPEDVCFVDNTGLICDDVEVMTENTIALAVTGVEADVTYNWVITALSGGPFTGDANPQTDQNTLNISFDQEGVYDVCITALGHPCAALGWNGNICRRITVENNPTNECETDTIAPLIQATDLSSAVVTNTGEVKIYARDFIFFAEDNCTPFDSLIYAFNPQGPEYDDFYDESVRSSFKYLDCCNAVNSPEAIAIYVFDLAENYSADTVVTIIVPPIGGGCEGCENDTIPPELEIFDNIQWVFNKDSSYVEIWASDFVSSATDNCTGPSNLKYSFSDTSPFDDPSSSFMTFYCEDVEDSPFTVAIYAWDKSGNYVLDSSVIVIQPEMGLDCDNFAEEITGSVFKLDNNPIEGAMVYLEKSNGDIIDSVATDENGNYSLFAIPAQKFLRIEYETSDNPLITFMDIIAIQQYMLGLIQFSIPEILAADINSDGKVKVNDLRIMRKIIFGIIDQNDYLGNTWKFSTMDGGMEQLGINRIAIEQAQVPDLIGYRIGDLR